MCVCVSVFVCVCRVYFLKSSWIRGPGIASIFRTELNTKQTKKIASRSACDSCFLVYVCVCACACACACVCGCGCGCGCGCWCGCVYAWIFACLCVRAAQIVSHTSKNWVVLCFVHPCLEPTTSCCTTSCCTTSCRRVWRHRCRKKHPSQRNQQRYSGQHQHPQ